MKTTVITGVSTGIGYAAAAELVRRGQRVFGSVRRMEDAKRLQAKLGDGLVPLVFDVTDAAGVKAAARTVHDVVGTDGIDGLVNNAGISVVGPAMHLPVEEYRRQFEVNFFGVIAVTQAFLPMLKPAQTRAPGRIVNISSVSGRVAYPFLSAYAASKHALEAYSDSLRRELMLYGIDVIVIEPGSVRTPIWEKAEQADFDRYIGTDFHEILERMQKVTIARARNSLPVDVVTDAIVSALESNKPRVRYALPSRRVTGWWLPRWGPARWFDRQVAKRLGLARP